MINPQLLNYVRAQRAAGVSKEEIIKALAGGGWSALDAQEAFAALEGVTVPPAAPRSAPPLTQAPVQTPAPQPRPVAQAPKPFVQPAVQTAQTSVRMQSAPVVQRQPVYAQVKKRRVWPWLFLLVIFLVGGFAGGAYMAVEYPWVASMVQDVKSLISPPTLEPVTDENIEDPTFEPFASTTPPLGGGSTSTGTTTP